jgi:hypothetical protein
MSPLAQLPGVIRPNPPPLWLVTNGEITVGPVVTHLLKKGVAYGKVPEYCQVRPRGGAWRKLEAVREIAAMYGSGGGGPVVAPDVIAELVRPSAPVRDQDELCYGVARIAALITGAESAMLHYAERGSRSMVTRGVFGPVSHALLDEELPETDFVLRSARVGRPIYGPPFGPIEDALALRFASSAGGVGGAAMIPIFVGRTLRAMLELSRPGHAFRWTDLERAERVALRALHQHES